MKSFNQVLATSALLGLVNCAITPSELKNTYFPEYPDISSGRPVDKDSANALTSKELGGY